MRPIFSYIKYLIFIFGILYASVAIAQDFSNKGREFWVGYGSHVSMYNANGTVNTTNGGSQNMVLYFTSDQDANVTVEIPASVELVIADTEPGVQGDRVSGAKKPATLETGKVIQVPLFVNVGDKVKVDTRSGDYITRV